MIQAIASAQLPADEILQIKRNRLKPEGLNGKGAGRISIVTGIHGDELEGQYVCFELNRIIREKMDQLHGIVDIYPAMNPFGIDTVSRGIPGFDLDMNRIFPGNDEGDMMEYIAAEMIEDLTGSDVCVDIHASNIFLTEIPQIRINELNREELIPLAEKMNVDLIWVHGNSTVLESTLAYSLNSLKSRTLVVEMGVGMRITKSYCEQLVTGILNLMTSMGIWTGGVGAVREPLLSEQPDDVEFLNAECCGVFVKDRNHGEMVKKGERIGRILDPLAGEVRSEIYAPEDGLLFTIREYPIVEIGSLTGRILKHPTTVSGKPYQELKEGDSR